jgi:hypothetical protein
MRALLLAALLVVPLFVFAPSASASFPNQCTPTLKIPAPEFEICATHQHDWYCVTATLDGEILYQYCKWFLGP